MRRNNRNYEKVDASTIVGTVDGTVDGTIDGTVNNNSDRIIELRK